MEEETRGNLIKPSKITQRSINPTPSSIHQRATLGQMERKKLPKPPRGGAARRHVTVLIHPVSPRFSPRHAIFPVPVMSWHDQGQKIPHKTVLERVGHPKGTWDASQGRLSDNQGDLAHGQPMLERKGKWGATFLFPFARGVARPPFRRPDAWMR